MYNNNEQYNHDKQHYKSVFNTKYLVDNFEKQNEKDH